MPRFTAPAPNGESRKALEQRAREAAKPASLGEKKHWPFAITSHDTYASANGDSTEVNADCTENKAQSD